MNEGPMQADVSPSLSHHVVIRYAASSLKNLICRVLTSYAVPEDEARIIADVLVEADRRGIPSHGVGRLAQYSHRLRAGMILPTTQILTLRESGAVLSLDAGQGWGHVAGQYAMRRCMEKARQSGICVATVRRSTHFGIAAYYAMMPLELGMIGFATTNTRPHVAPTFGSAPALGTNPVALAAPALRERPFVLDMSTSTVAMGKIEMCERIREALPSVWAIDEQGEVCMDPTAVRERGALLPLGGFSETSGYKGYGLAFLVDILSGVLAGASFGPLMTKEREESGPNIGHMFAAVDIAAFRPVDGFRQDMDRMIRAVRSTSRQQGENRIYVAGEKEFEQSERNDKLGIPLLPYVVSILEAETSVLGIPLDLEPIG